MTSSPELIHALRASRPVAPVALRTRVREIAREQPSRVPVWARFQLPVRRIALVAAPAVVALALVSAGAVGLSRSDGTTEVSGQQNLTETTVGPEATPGTRSSAPPVTDSAIGPTTGRAQRVSATLTVEVSNPDEVSRAAQEALDLTRRVGGHVVSASVVTGEEGSAALTVRVPVARVQEAIVQLSALGRIVSQQVRIDDLQQALDTLERRRTSVQSQIALVRAQLESDTLDPVRRAQLEARLRTLRGELRQLRSGISATNAEARMATIQLTVTTPDSGAAAVPSRLERTLDEALNVLVWEGVVAIAIAIVAAPFALVAFAAWLGRRFYRRREDERLLAT